MADYRHYFLDHDGRIDAREEFRAPDDETAKKVSACIAAVSDDMHSGYMLWRGAALLCEMKKGDGLDTSHPASPVSLDVEAQQIALDFEHRLLESRWTVSRSRRLLDATRDLESVAKRRDGG